MPRLATLLLVLLGTAVAAHAQAAVEPMDLAPYRQRAGDLFNPRLVTEAGSPLSTAAENLLLMSQAVAAVLIVAGMIGKLRKDQVQMEGIASMMLKVAFIAMVPLLRVQVLDTVDTAATALGYQTAATAGTPSPMLSGMWNLLGQWTPPGSPYLDALETQAAEPPASGHEEEWPLSAWNWAKGVGTTTSSMFDTGWQAVSGGIRAGAVLAGCGAMACITSLTLILAYLSEVLRYLLFFAGCAVLPVFIAALGVDTLRGPAVRFIVFLVSVACWPVGWALAHGVTAIMTGGLLTWITSVSAAALTAPAGGAVPPLAVAAPFVGWGGLFLFMGATVAICLWVAATVLGAPLAIGRLISVGANAAAIAVGADGVAAGAGGSRTGNTPAPPRAAARSDAGRPPRVVAESSLRFVGAPAFRSVAAATVASPVASMRESMAPPTAMPAVPRLVPSAPPPHSSVPGSLLSTADGSPRIAPWLLSPARSRAQ